MRVCEWLPESDRPVRLAARIRVRVCEQLPESDWPVRLAARMLTSSSADLTGCCRSSAPGGPSPAGVYENESESLSY